MSTTTLDLNPTAPRPPEETAPLTDRRQTNPMFNDQKMKLGLFGSNCSGGLCMTDAPTTYEITWKHEIPLSEANRRAGLVALEIVDRAIELGFLPPAPAPRACTWCDFRTVCGPDEEKHLARKPTDLLGDLTALREMP